MGEPLRPSAAIERISPLGRALARSSAAAAALSSAAAVALPLAAATALLLVAPAAHAERVSLLGFEGDKAVSLRWRVASALKRAGHTVLGVAPPKDPEDTEQLRAYARRRRVDVFLAGTSAGGGDGWELTITLRNASGDRIGSEVTLSAPTLREMIREIKGDGQERLDRAVSGAGSEPSFESDEDDGAGRAKPRGSKRRPSRAVEEPIDLDADERSSDDDVAFDADEGASEAAADDEPAGGGAAKAKGWAASDEASADDGRESFLSEDGDADEEVGVDSGEESAEAAGTSAEPTVVLGLNAGFLRRTLSYSDDIYGRLRAPNANAWVYRLEAAVYPFARPVKNRIGLVAGYESEFSGVVRDDLAGTDFPVSFSELYGGLKLRQPLGAHEIALQGAVAATQSGLDDPDSRSGVPAFDYTSLRAALEVGLRFGGLALKGSAGYRLPIGGYGEASDANWFPRMEGYGVEAAAGLTYQISKEVAFDVSGSMRRFLLQMNSQPADALGGVSEVAGGAVDLYLGGYFGLSIML